jgi:endoglucanase
MPKKGAEREIGNRSQKTDVTMKPIVITTIILTCFAFSRCSENEQANAPAEKEKPAEIDAFAQNTAITRGVNLGNALEAPTEGEWGVVLQAEYFQLIGEAGFDAVRVPVRWSAHAQEDEPFRIADGFFKRIDWVIEQAFANGLHVVLNMHHYEELYDEPEEHRARFLALWQQIARRYQYHASELIFEILNEPHGNLEAEEWNALLVEGLATVRETNPYRNVVIGPVQWNNVDALPGLVLPEDDRHIIVTVHYYNPFNFTHQGAGWVSGSDPWLGTKWTGSASEKTAIDRDLDKAVAYGTEHNRPVLVGEFGAYNRADMDSRARWTYYVSRQAEKRNMSWAYWEFCAGFGIYDSEASEWRGQLLRALIP